MDIRKDYSGAKKTIYRLVLGTGSNETSPAVEFLRQLKVSNPKSHKQMVLRYQRHANNGPSPNEKHERHISGNLFEFKTNYGDRLLYFNHTENRTVLISGFHSGHNIQAQTHYQNAASLRDQYLAEEEQRGSTGRRGHS